MLTMKIEFVRFATALHIHTQRSKICDSAFRNRKFAIVNMRGHKNIGLDIKESLRFIFFFFSLSYIWKNDRGIYDGA